MKCVPVQYVTHQCQWVLGHFLLFPREKLSSFFPTPLTGHSSAGQRDYWGSSISYVLSYNDYGSIMQFLKQKAKKWNLQIDMKKCPNEQKNRHECMKE